MIEVKECEVCNNKKLINVLNLGMHPLCDDLVEIGDDRVCNEFPIEILYCNICFTAHQRFQVPKEKLFTKNYHYRARMTGSVLTGMADLVENCEKTFGPINGKFALDIGCNDGSLLDFFKEKGCKTVGIDPTDAVKDSKHKSYQMYFDKRTALMIKEEHGIPDFITFTNVFAHIENLPELLNNLRILLDDNTKLIIENHYLGAVLRTDQFDTFYHEHPRTYSFRSFKFIASSLGLKVLNAQYVSRYGGNIRVFLGQGKEKANVVMDENKFYDGFIKLSHDVEKWKKDYKNKIFNHVEKFGKIRAKAFSGVQQF